MIHEDCAMHSRGGKSQAKGNKRDAIYRFVKEDGGHWGKVNIISDLKFTSLLEVHSRSPVSTDPAMKGTSSMSTDPAMGG
jgi:hypothetical protein